MRYLRLNSSLTCGFGAAKRLSHVKPLVKPAVTDWSSKQYSELGVENFRPPHPWARTVPRVTPQQAVAMLRLPLSHHTPLIITGLLDHWQVTQEWDAAVKGYGAEAPVQVGEDDAGFRVELPLEEFWQYVLNDSDGDDEPLYALDDALLDDLLPRLGRTCSSPPLIFRQVAHPEPFAGWPVEDQPPMRWMVIGGARSGSAIHADPVGCAWNAVIQGAKRWVFFPPPDQVLSNHKHGSAIRAFQDSLRLDEYDGDAKGIMSWFVEVHGNLGERSMQNFELDSTDWTIWEGTQRSGETIYVPNGWLHGALNLDATVAVTENFMLRHDHASA